MDMQISWTVNVEIAPELNGFANVVTRVFWACVARSEDGAHRLTGVEDIPAPVDPTSYIDISDLKAKPRDQRRAEVLSWAEILKPGFIASTEAATTAALDQRTAAASATVVEL